MNKRVVAAIAAVVVAAGIGGVAALALRDPAPVKLAPAQKVSPSPTQDPEAVFLMAVRIEFPDAPGTETVRLGHTYCELLDSGVTLDRIVEHSTANRYLAGVVAGAAIVTFCPQHEGQIQR